MHGLQTKNNRGESHLAFSIKNIGNIYIEKGKVAMCDLLAITNIQPFVQDFPVGRFAVELAIADFGEYKHVAFCRINFKPKPVEKWEFALRPDQAPVEVTDKELYHCNQIVSGIGLFIDSRAYDIFVSNGNNLEDLNMAFEEDKGIFEDGGFIHDFEGRNMGIFMTGNGPGCYSTYIGYDKEGNICRLIADFGLVKWWNI